MICPVAIITFYLYDASLAIMALLDSFVVYYLSLQGVKQILSQSTKLTSNSTTILLMLQSTCCVASRTFL